MTEVNQIELDLDAEDTGPVDVEVLTEAPVSEDDSFTAPRKIKPKTQADVRTRGFSKWFSE